MKPSLLLTTLVGASLLSCEASAAEKTLTVATDGSGNFKTVQEAIAAVPDKSADRTTIQIKPGTYQGFFVVSKDKTNVTLQGDTAEKVILTWDQNVVDPLPSGNRKFNPGLSVEGKGFRAVNLTIQNTAGDRGQALAASVNADCTVFKKCRILGWQDTLMANTGRQYYHDCYIEGRVDFIYGAGTAVFKDCTIHSKNGGYVTATNTPEGKPFGFVFLNCKLTGDDVPWVATTAAAPTGDASPTPAPRSYKKPNAFLGRPWRQYSSVAFINCDIGDHIKPEGWSNWGKPAFESTVRYAEYGNTGPGATPDKRVPWAKQLSKEDADKLTVEAILGGDDHWTPQ